MKPRIRTLTTLILCTVIVVSLMACSSSGSSSSPSGEKESAAQESEKQEEIKQEPLDLTGNWVQKDAEGSESYMAGYIKDDVIEVFWISDGGKTGNLYWSGSYAVPTEPGDSYTWDSANDKIKTDYALLASSDDTKTFSYENGEISYSVSMMGQTALISLVPTETDYSVFAPAGGSSGSAQDGQQVVLENSVYSWMTDEDSCTLYYAVKIHNPNEEYAVQFPKIQITARSEDNTILTTEEQTLSGIAANDTIVYANEIYYEGGAPASVEMTVGNEDRNYMHQEGSGIIRQADLAISNVNENVGEYETTYTGELTNNSTLDLDTVSVILVFKSGDNMIGGICTYVDNVRSGETKPFEIDSYGNLPEFDSYEVYAMQW